MKIYILFSALALICSPSLYAEPTHLDIMVPDLQDTDLKGSVKSVKLQMCKNISNEYITEERTYDRQGNLLKTSEWDEDGELTETTTYDYDENGCYTTMHYVNSEDKEKVEHNWEIILSPSTHQLAMKESSSGYIGLVTYSDQKYMLSYKLMDEKRKPFLAFVYKRDENNREISRTRYEDNKPYYTYYYKWAENGFIDMERQSYHQEKAEYLHTYEYLVIDEHGNWTQRILARYRLDKGKKELVYEHTVERTIEYYEPEDEGVENEISEKAEN